MTRRSTRVRARIPILITSLDPATPFSLLCETLIVNAHGCAAKIPQPLEIGTPVRLRIAPPPASKTGDTAARETREVTARTVLCQPITGNQSSWVVGIEMDTPGNIWGVTPAPEDWKRFEVGRTGVKAPAGRPAIELKMPLWPLASPAAKASSPAGASDSELKKQLAAQQETIAVLENRLAKSLASLPGMVREQLAQSQQQTLAQARQQLGAMLAETVQEKLPAQTEAIAKLQERLTALETIPEAIRRQLADAQQQTLAQARQQLGTILAETVQEKLPAQTEAIARLQERLAALESLPSAVRKQLAETQQETLTQARQQLGALLAETVQDKLPVQTEAIARLQERLAAVESIPEAIRRQLADAQLQTLAQARQQLGAMLAETVQEKLPAQTEAMARLQERLAALETIPEAVRKQLADGQQQTLAQARQQLGVMLAESVQRQLPAQNEVISKLQERLAALESLPSAVRKQLTDAQQETLAQARTQLGTMLDQALQEQFTTQSNAIARLQQRVAAFESLPDEVRKLLADAQQRTLAQSGEMGSALTQSVQERLAGQSDAIDRLQQRLSSLESFPDAVRKQLAEAQQRAQAQLGEQIDSVLAERLRPLQQELAAFRGREQDGAQVRAAVAEQLEQLPWQVQQHAEAAFQALQDQARAEVERIIAEKTKLQDIQQEAHRQALETSSQALHKELAQAREKLESTVQEVHQRIQEPIAAAVEEALAQAGAEISARVARELEALHERGRMVRDELHSAADSLRSEREATSAQLVATAAQREQLQLWLAEQQAAYAQQADHYREKLAEEQTAYLNDVRQKLEQFAGELAARGAAVLKEQIQSDIENQAGNAEADLDRRLGPMLNRASDLRQEILSLLETLQKESERCQTQARTLLEEKDSVDDWMRERAAEFQQTFNDAMVETTGQIRGRLQMAVEMIAEPVEKLRAEAAQQLQEQAARQARQLREDTDEVTERLRSLRRDLENAVRESLRTQAAETVAAFGREIAETAQESVDEWRSALARNLESLSGALAQKLPGGGK